MGWYQTRGLACVPVAVVSPLRLRAKKGLSTPICQDRDEVVHMCGVVDIAKPDCNLIVT